MDLIKFKYHAFKKTIIMMISLADIYIATLPEKLQFKVGLRDIQGLHLSL